MIRKGCMNRRSGCSYVHLAILVRSIYLSEAVLFHTDIKSLDNQLTRSIYVCYVLFPRSVP